MSLFGLGSEGMDANRSLFEMSCWVMVITILSSCSAKNHSQTLEADEAPSKPKRAMRTAYVELNNDTIDLVGTYEDDKGRPAFDVAVIFAANIRGKDGNAEIHLNDNVKRQLDKRHEDIRNLQRKGIKVLASFLNDWQDAGWSCFRDWESSLKFAQELKAFVQKYELDGIEIDDEYDQCTQKFDHSLAMVTTAIKQVIPHKILAKSLFVDSRYFAASFERNAETYTLGKNLDYGWEMSYGGSNCQSRGGRYLEFMDKSKIGVGASMSHSAETAQSLHECVLEQDFGGGLMIFNLKRHQSDWVSIAMNSRLSREPAEGDLYPRGSWVGSCTQHSYESGILTANCRSRSGDYGFTSVEASLEDYVENIDGQLVVKD